MDCACTFVRGQAVPSDLGEKVLGRHRLSKSESQEASVGSLGKTDPKYSLLLSMHQDPSPRPSSRPPSGKLALLLVQIRCVRSLSRCFDYSEEQNQEMAVVSSIGLPTVPDPFCLPAPSQRTLNPSHNIHPSPP